MTQRWIHLLLVLGAVATGGSAAGQNRPPYQRMTADAVREMAETLGLSAAETAEALAAHQRYLDELEQATVTSRALMRWNYDHRVDLTQFAEPEEIDDQRNNAHIVLEQIWQYGVRELEMQFFQTLGSIAPDRLALVASLERERLRDRVVPLWGIYNVFPHPVPLLDVAAYAREQLPSELRTDQIEALLQEYELTVDPMLRRIDEFRVEWMELNRHAQRVAEREAERGHVEFDDVERTGFAGLLEAHRLIASVRELERRTLLQLSGLLPSPYAEQFRGAHDDHLFDWAEEEGQALKAYFDSTLSREEISPGQREALIGLRTRFEAARRRAIPTLAAQLRDLQEIKYIKGWYGQLVRFWQFRDDPWVPYRPPEFLEYEEQKRVWRNEVRDFEREARLILGEPAEEDGQ